MIRIRRMCVALAVVALWSGAEGVAAQTRLERVEELTRLGRADEARVELATWWEEDRDAASRREQQRGLWLRARLTVDPVQAELDFQRIAVLYPSGQFAAPAIFRLAQAAFALGDADGARRYVETLVRDYPSSETRVDAEAWLASAGEPPPVSDVREPISTAEPTAPADSVAAKTADPVKITTEEPTDTEDEPEAFYYVQLGAFADVDRALSLYEDLLDSGVDVRVVRVEGSRLTHVRVGRFIERFEAAEALDALAQRGISASLVRDERPEQPLTKNE